MLLLEFVYFTVINGELIQFKSFSSFVSFSVIDSLDTRHYHIVTKPKDSNSYVYTLIHDNDILDLKDGTIVVKFVDYGSTLDTLEEQIVSDYNLLIEKIKTDFNKGVSDDLFDVDDEFIFDNDLDDDEEDGIEDDDDEEGEDDDEYDEYDEYYDEEKPKSKFIKKGKTPIPDKSVRRKKKEDIYEEWERDSFRSTDLKRDIDLDFFPSEWEE